MSVVPGLNLSLPRRSSDPANFWGWALFWVVLVSVATAYLGEASNSLASRLVVGNLTFTLALGFGLIRCLQAARPRSEDRKGWIWMSIALGVGFLGQVYVTFSATQGPVARPPAYVDALTYLGYVPPLIIAPFCFPIPRERLISRFRRVVDAIVISTGVLLVSEATVLSVVRQRTDVTGAAGLVVLAEPVADIAICAVVLTLGMRQPPEKRRSWFCLGAGLLSLAVTDSIYVRMMAEGGDNLTATPLVAGWAAAPILIGLSTRLRAAHGDKPRSFDLVAQLVPYVPVIGATILLVVRPVLQDAFLVVGGTVLLVTVAARQVMIVYENVSLTRDLEAKVAARTAELATLGSIVTSSRDAIVGIDVDEVIQAWNPAAERLFGYQAADVLGRTSEFLPMASTVRIERLLRSAKRGEALDAYELDWQRPDGTVVPVAMTVSPIVDGGAVTGISVSSQDITERRRTAATLEQAREDALQSARAKSEFLATMSHEIRTPMNGVIGLVSLLMDTELDAQQRGYAEGVHTAGQALLDVINDILDFSKLEAGKVVLDADDFDLRRLVDEVGNLLAPAAFAKGLELLVDYPPGSPGVVRGDHVRIRQILLNLASNAVKFTSVGEVAIRVLAQPLPDEGVSLRFEVSDTGIGIDESQQGKLFESFSQADASTTRRYGGTGLGLAICRHLVEVMEGAIGLTSARGVGSTFWFELTLPRGVSDEAGLATPVDESVPLPAGLRVLVVDDNATNRTILAGQLASWGVEADLVESAWGALGRLRHAIEEGRPYDLALLDMLMPEVDGLELARRVTADPALGTLPMIMLTSSYQVSTTVMREAGIQRWLTKPVRAAGLRDAIARVLLRDGAVRAPTTEVSAPTQAPTGSSSRGRALIVEDNELNQLVASGLVRRLGFEVQVASNGAEALSALEAGGFDIVLMDCHMPVMDGFAATEEIRRRERGGRRTPVVALTAGALVSDRERCLAAGMDDYISKPIEPDVLSEVLDRWVDTSRVASPAAAGAHVPAGAAGRVELEQRLDDSRLEGLADLRSPDGQSLLTSFVASFTGRASERMNTLRRCIEVGDDAALRAAAHELKGSAATIGAVRVAALAAELESRGAGALESRPLVLDELEQELERAGRMLLDVALTHA